MLKSTKIIINKQMHGLVMIINAINHRLIKYKVYLIKSHGPFTGLHSLEKEFFTARFSPFLRFQGAKFSSLIVAADCKNNCSFDFSKDLNSFIISISNFLLFHKFRPVIILFCYLVQ